MEIRPCYRWLVVLVALPEELVQVVEQAEGPF